MLQTQRHDAKFDQNTTYARIQSWFLAALKYLVTRRITLKYRPYYNLCLFCIHGFNC